MIKEIVEFGWRSEERTPTWVLDALLRSIANTRQRRAGEIRREVYL